MLKVWGLCCENCKWVEICCRLRFLSFSLRVSAWLWQSWLLKCEYTGPCGSSAVGRQLPSIPCGVRGHRGSVLVVLGCLSRERWAPAAPEEQLSDLQCLHCWKRSIQMNPGSAMWGVFYPGSVFSLPAASAFQHHSCSWSTPASVTMTCWSHFRKVSFFLFMTKI